MSRFDLRTRMAANLADKIILVGSWVLVVCMLIGWPEWLR